jgi:hypothetical protein
MPCVWWRHDVPTNAVPLCLMPPPPTPCSTLSCPAGVCPLVLRSSRTPPSSSWMNPPQGWTVRWHWGSLLHSKQWHRQERW